MTALEVRTPLAERGIASYRAAVVHDFTKPLAIEDVPRRALEPGQIRVRVEASGLCHTDIHAAHGDWPVKPSPPFMPGHEGVGIVEEIGPGVTEVVLGDRVAMPWLGYACGTCDYCVSGWETLCLEQKNMGYSIDGGFGEYATAYARYVVQGARRHRPVRRRTAHVRRRDDVQGGEGRRHAIVRPRRRLRRRRPRPPGDPVRADRRRTRRRSRSGGREARARKGARRRVHRQRSDRGSGRCDPGARRRRPGNRAGRLADRSSRPTARSAAAARSVFVALPAENGMTLPIFETVLNGITVVGSIVGTRTDLREVFELHAAGKTTVIREVRPLDEVERGDRGRRGRPSGRPRRLHPVGSA